MTGATMTTADAVLKEVYENVVTETVNNEVPVLKLFNTTAEGVQMDTTHLGGYYTRFACHSKRNPGVGARREGETIPSPGNQGYYTAQLNLAYLYGAVQVSGQVLKLADTNVQSFVSIVDDEITRITDDLAVDLGRQFYGDGSGKLATTSAVGAATTVTLDVAYDGMNFSEGMLVDVFTAADFATYTATPSAGSTFTPKATVTVDSIDVDAGTVTFASSVTYAAGDTFVRQGNVNREIIGLDAIVNTTDLYNVTVSSEPSFKSYINSNGGTLRAVSAGLVTGAIDKVYTKGGKTDLVLWGDDVRRSYENLLTQIREISNTTDLTGGVSSVGLATDRGNIPLMSDFRAPRNTIWGLNKKYFTLYHTGDFSWYDKDGSRWIRVGRSDASEAWLYRYLQLGCHRRNAQFKIEDVTGVTV